MLLKKRKKVKLWLILVNIHQFFQAYWYKSVIILRRLYKIINEQAHTILTTSNFTEKTLPAPYLWCYQRIGANEDFYAVPCLCCLGFHVAYKTASAETNLCAGDMGTSCLLQDCPFHQWNRSWRRNRCPSQRRRLHLSFWALFGGDERSWSRYLSRQRLCWQC